MQRIQKAVLMHLLACVTILTAGCGGGGLTSPVEGTVRLDGKPLESATVTFQPSNGRPSVGITDSAGHYELKYTGTEDGALPGSHRVRITTAIPGMSGEGDQPSVEGFDELLPAKYHEQTELTASVETKSNTIDFDLQSD